MSDEVWVMGGETGRVLSDERNLGAIFFVKFLRFICAIPYRKIHGNTLEYDLENGLRGGRNLG